MTQPFIGQIIPVAFNFAPVGWLPCDGRALPIAEYDVLFTLIGTSFGGDGTTTFCLPNLNGRVIVGAGQFPGAPSHPIGQSAGAEQVLLDATQMGGHTHAFAATDRPGTTNTPGPTAILAANPDAAVFVYGPGTGTAQMAGAAIGPAGGAQAHENRQPFLTINYIIAPFGIFPPQS